MDSSVTGLKSSTKKAQTELASYVRSGKLIDIDGARSERLPHYRRLVFNVIFDTLSSAFPIARKVVSSSWLGLVDRYFSNHNCQNYQVWRMPKEFMNYVLEHENEIQQEIPFLADLLFFEWIEIELYSESDIEVEDQPLNGSWENSATVLNPHHRILKLSYPVFTNEYENMGAQSGQYYLAVFRNLKELKVRFVQLSPLFGEALIQLNAFECQLLDALQNVSMGITEISRTDLASKAEPIVNLLEQKNLILGYKK